MNLTVNLLITTGHQYTTNTGEPVGGYRSRLILEVEAQDMTTAGARAALKARDLMGDVYIRSASLVPASAEAE